MARAIRRIESAEELCSFLRTVPQQDWGNILIHHGYRVRWSDIDHRQGWGTVMFQRGREHIRYSYDDGLRQWAEVSHWYDDEDQWR